jgi:hypothetical protein
MKRIALVGTAPSRASAPYDDLSVEIWGVGNRAPEVKRATRWFELHRLAGEPPDWQVEWRKAIKAWPKDFELWMLYPEPDLAEKVVHIDTAPLVAKYGTYFMTSSFSWMMAIAIEEILATGEPGEILLYGVDMEFGTEYREQRNGLRHFIEIAKVLGIYVRRVVTSGIAYEPIPYPLWQDDPLLAKIKLRSDWIKEQLEPARHTVKTYQSMLDQNIGILRILKEMKAAEEFDIDARIKMISIAKMEGAHDEQSWMHDYLMP